jgi:hypothetical protein
MSPSDSANVPSPVTRSGSPGPDTPVRLVRLRPEFARLYAGLDAGAWYPAASVVPREAPWLPGQSPEERQLPGGD